MDSFLDLSRQERMKCDPDSMIRTTFVVNSLRDDGGNIIYVKADATGINNGTSWTNAYTGLQDGINAASDGDSVWVAGGTYQPGVESSYSFSMKGGVAIYGGFAGSENSFDQRKIGAGHISTLVGNDGSSVIEITSLL